MRKGVRFVGCEWILRVKAELFRQAESRVRVVRTYIRKVGTELYSETTLEK